MITTKRKFKAGDDAAPLWMISFCDLQAQIIVFFAFILSFSTIDPIKAAQVGAAFEGANGRQAPPPRDNFIVWWVMSHQIASNTGQAVSQEQWGPEGREFLVQRTSEGLRISLERALTFDEGSAAIRPDQADAVAGFIRFVRGSLNKLDVRGFVAPNEVVADSEAWKLSLARAQAVADLLMHAGGDQGIDPARIRVTGMGKNDPVVDIIETRDLFQQARNRRVEILVLEEKAKVR